MQKHRYLWEEAVRLNLIIVLYAPDGLINYIEILNTFLEANPSCKVVITHLGNPDIKEFPDFKSYRSIFSLSRYSNVYYQISGMKMFCDYPHQQLYPLIAEIVEHFDASRLMWASNYPIVGDAEDYIKDLHLLLDRKLPVPEKAVEDVAGNNAYRLWFSDGM